MATVYTGGTVTVSNGSTSVTGSGTTWATAGVQAGDYLWSGGYSVRIAAVTDNTHLTLAYPWPGAGLAGASNFEIRYTSSNERVMAAANTLIALLESGNNAALGGLTGAANKGVYFTGSGTMATYDLSPFGRSLVDDADGPAAQATLGISSTYAKLLPSDGGASLGGSSNRYANGYFRDNIYLGGSSVATTIAMIFNTTAGKSREMRFRTGGLDRWLLRTHWGDETGSNAGSDFELQAYDDAGSFLSAPLYISRATGIITLGSATKLKSYTVSTLPSASVYAQCLIYVSNGTSNNRLAVSDGTNWRWPGTGAIVS